MHAFPTFSRGGILRDGTDRRGFRNARHSWTVAFDCHNTPVWNLWSGRIRRRNYPKFTPGKVLRCRQRGTDWLWKLRLMICWLEDWLWKHRRVWHHGNDG